MIAITGNIDPRSEPYPATDSAAMGLVGMAAGAEAGGIAVLQSQRRPSRRRPHLGRPERRDYRPLLHLTGTEIVPIGTVLRTRGTNADAPGINIIPKPQQHRGEKPPNSTIE